MCTRKRIIGLIVIFILIGIGFWYTLSAMNSGGIVRAELTRVGATNLDDRQFVLLRLNNSGSKTILWQSADIPWMCRVETDSGWTNFNAGHMTGLCWLRPGENKEFKVQLPRETRQWQVSVVFQEASVGDDVAAKLHDAKIGRFVPNLLRRLIPGADGKYHEIRSALYTNAPKGESER